MAGSRSPDLVRRSLAFSSRLPVCHLHTRPPLSRVYAISRRRPDWVSFADRLSAVSEDSFSFGEETLVAHLARVVALETGWSTPEQAFWHSLTETARVSIHHHAVELVWLEGHEKCRVDRVGV